MLQFRFPKTLIHEKQVLNPRWRHSWSTVSSSGSFFDPSGVELFLWRIWRFDSRRSTFFQTGRQRKGLLVFALRKGFVFLFTIRRQKRNYFQEHCLCLQWSSSVSRQRAALLPNDSKFGVSYCFKCSPGVSQLSIFGLTLCLGLLTFDIFFVSIFSSSDCLLSFSNSPFSSIETVTNLGPHFHPILDIIMLFGWNTFLSLTIYVLFLILSKVLGCGVHCVPFRPLLEFIKGIC